MTVYVLSGGFDYSGSEPVAVYGNFESAMSAVPGSHWKQRDDREWYTPGSIPDRGFDSMEIHCLEVQL